MEINRKKLFVVGDRVLVTPDSGEDRTRVGLLLPATAVEKMAVQGGRVQEVGPGTPVPNPADFNDEPWKVVQQNEPKGKYMPMEAKVGDFVLFLRNAAVEIEFEGEQYLIVPHAAILLLVRDPVEEVAKEDDEDEEFREEDFKL